MGPAGETLAESLTRPEKPARLDIVRLDMMSEPAWRRGAGATEMLNGDTVTRIETDLSSLPIEPTTVTT